MISQKNIIAWLKEPMATRLPRWVMILLYLLAVGFLIRIIRGL